MASSAYCTADGKVYLFGGPSGYGMGQEFFNNIYVYDVGTNTMTLRATPGVRPAPRQKAGFAYDSANNVFLMYGGVNDSGLGTTPPAFGDTWIYDSAAVGRWLAGKSGRPKQGVLVRPARRRRSCGWRCAPLGVVSSGLSDFA
jgi:hypothetical protein